jgi:osmotically-inducible protein OsmY
MRVITAAGLGIVALCGCAGSRTAFLGEGDTSSAWESADQPAGAKIEDSSITARVRSTYGVDPVLDAGQIDVATEDGVVTLRGTLDDPAAGQRAISLALETPGVREVRSELRFPTKWNQAKTSRPGGPQVW